MSYVYQHKVYDYSTVQECWDVTGAPPVDTRWLDTNKGDIANPLYRSRWVAKQFKRSWIETAFAATPNVESIRLLLADAAGQIEPTTTTGNNTEEDLIILIV